MKQKHLLVLAFIFALATSANAQFKPVSISGFNADIIANGVGDASLSTNIGADAGSYALVSEDFTAVSGGTPPTFFLPASRIISSASTAGLAFQLSDYSQNNVSRLATATSTSETLSLDTPQTAAEVYLLAYSGSGSSTADITLNFSDGSTQTASFTIADWYNGTPFVMQGIGRVNITDNTFSGTSTNPRLYSIKFSVDYANFGKDINSISISKTNTSTSVLGILAVSILNFNPAYSPVDITGFNVDVIADGMGDPNFSTTSDVDGATPPYAFVAADYQYTSSCSAPVRSLPLSGFISSNAVPGMTYQLAAYTGNNDLRLAGTDVGTLTFTTPVQSKSIYLLAVGGNGAARISATVTFSDNTTRFFDNLDISDWYSGTTNIVTGGIGRIMKTTTTCGGLETSATSPRLYQIPLVLDTADYMKTVVSVTITRIDGVTGFAGIANILGITVEKAFVLLPVKLVDFKGYATETNNILTWKTLSENNNRGFKVEKSTNGEVFSTLRFVNSKAANGNSTGPINYTFADSKSSPEANSYYRLKQVDKDGKTTFSDILFIKGNKANSLQVNSLYPNPSHDNFTVAIASPVTQIVTITLSDIAGKNVLQKNVNVIAGNTNYSINTENLKAGNYFVKINCSVGCNLAYSKFVKL